MLETELDGDPRAPCYVLRLWGHCQQQQTHRFPKLSAVALAAITGFKGAHEALWLALQNSGFIELKGDVVEVHEWDKYNASLITSWRNGKKGGRPKKPTGNPRVTHGQPESNPDETRSKPIEKRREDREESIPSPAAGGAPKKEVERNPLLDSLVFGQCGTVEGVPAMTWKFANSALTQIKAVMPTVTADEITRRWKNLRTREFSNDLTVAALVKWWTQADQPTTNGHAPAPPIYSEPANLRKQA